MWTMELYLNHISKIYDVKRAVDDVNLKLTPGVYGLLGANGAGKTTLMRIICDIQEASGGCVEYNHQNIAAMGEEYRSALGYLPQSFGYYPDFTAYRFLLYLAAMKGLSKGFAKEKSLQLLDTVGLLEVKDRRIKTFSGGMKQRLGIAQALLADPKILVLDEPTVGLDPKERVKFRNMISSLSADKIVIFSTHIVSDVEYIADRILVMKDGRIIHQGRPEEITKEVEGKVWECRIPNSRVSEFVGAFNVGNLKHEGSDTVLRIVSDSRPAPHAEAVSATLEDLYLYYFEEAGEEHGQTD